MTAITLTTEGGRLHAKAVSTNLLITEGGRLYPAALPISVGVTHSGAAALSGSGTVAAAGSVTHAIWSGTAALSGSGTASASSSVQRPAAAALSGTGAATAKGLKVGEPVWDDQIGAGGNDGELFWWSGAGAWSPFATFIEMKHAEPNYIKGVWRWPSVGIPAGAQVKVAKIQFCSYWTTAAACNLRIQGFDEDNSAALASWADYVARPKTAEVDWDAVEAWTKDSWYWSTDFKAIVQSIVDLPGWNPGQAIQIIIGADPSFDSVRQAYSYETDPSLSAILRLEWTVVVVGQASLQGMGTAAVSGARTVPASAILSGSGTASASSSVQRPTAAALSASGAATASGQLVAAAQAALAGAGTSSVSGVRTRPGAVILSSQGLLSVSAGQMAWCAGTTLSGHGTVEAQAETGTERSGRADLSGAGGLVALATQGHTAAAPLEAEGIITAAAQSLRAAGATLSGSGSASAVGLATRNAASAILGAGGAVISSQLLLAGQSVLAGSGAMGASAACTRPAIASLEGAGAAAATGTQIHAPGASMSGEGTLTASSHGGQISPAAVTLAAVGSLSAIGALASATAAGPAPFVTEGGWLHARVIGNQQITTEGGRLYAEAGGVTTWVECAAHWRLWVGPADAPAKVQVTGLTSLLRSRTPTKTRIESPSGAPYVHGTGYDPVTGYVFASTRPHPWKLFRIHPDTLAYTYYTAPAYPTPPTYGERYGDDLVILDGKVYVVYGENFDNSQQTRLAEFNAADSPPARIGSHYLGDYGESNCVGTDGTYLYIGTGPGNSHNLIKVNPSTWEVVAGPVELGIAGSQVHDIQYDPDTGDLFVHSGNTLYRIEPSDLSIVDSQGFGPDLTDDQCLAGDYVFVGGEGGAYGTGYPPGMVYRCLKSDLSDYDEIYCLDETAGVSSPDCDGVFTEPGGEYVWAVYRTTPGQIARIKVSDCSFQRFWLADDETAVTEDIVFPGTANVMLVFTSCDDDWSLPFKVVRFENLIPGADDSIKAVPGRSYWWPLRLYLGKTPTGMVGDLKAYTDGINELGAGIDLKGNVAAAYTEPTGVPGEGGDELKPENYKTLAGAVEDALGWTLGSPKAISGLGVEKGDIGHFLVLQMLFGAGAPGGETPTEVLTLKHDDVGTEIAKAVTLEGWSIVVASCSLSAAGATTISGMRTRAVTAALVAAGAATAIAALTLPAAATLSGSGTASASSSVQRPAAAALSASGAATAASGVTRPDSSVFAGAGAANATGVRTFWAQAAPAGAGSVSVVGLITRNVAAVISAEGTVAAAGSVTHALWSGVSVLAGSGAVTATGSVGHAIWSGLVALDAEGNLTASGTQVHSGKSSLAGAGSITASSQGLPAGKAALSGNGVLTVSGTCLMRGTGLLEGDGALSAAGLKWTSHKKLIVTDYVDLFRVQHTLIRRSPTALYLFAVRLNATDTIRCYRSINNGTTWSAVDTENEPTTVYEAPLAAAADGAGVIHVLWSVDPNLRYCTFDTNTDTWGSPITLRTYAESSRSFNCDIGVDENNKQHVTWNEYSAFSVVFYMHNKTGSWSTPEKVYGETYSPSGVYPGIAVESGDNIHIAFWDDFDFYGHVMYRKRTSSGWGTTEDVTDANGINGYAMQLMISDQDGQPQACIALTTFSKVRFCQRITSGWIVQEDGDIEQTQVAGYVLNELRYGVYNNPLTGDDIDLYRKECDGVWKYSTLEHAAPGEMFFFPVTGEAYRHKFNAGIVDIAFIRYVSPSTFQLYYTYWPIPIFQATLSGESSVLVSGWLTTVGGVALSGSGSLAAAAVIAVVPGAAVLSGGGTLGAAAAQTLRCIVSLSGAGGLTTSGRLAAIGQTTLEGSGAATASGVRTRQGASSLDGSGSVSASAGQMAWVGNVALSGDGILEARAEVGSERVGRAVLGGTSTVEAIARQVHRAFASIGSEGIVGAASQVTRATGAALEGAGDLVPAGHVTRLAGAALSGSGAASTAGLVTRPASGTVSGGGSVVAVAVLTATGATTIGGEGSFTASAQLLAVGQGVLAGTGSASASGVRTRPAAASLEGYGSLAASAGQMAWAAVAVVAGQGALEARSEVGSERIGRAALAGEGTVAGTATQVHVVSNAVSGEGALTAAGHATRATASTLGAGGAASITAHVTRAAGAALEGLGGLVPAGHVTRLAGSTLSGSGAVSAASLVTRFATASVASEGALTAAGQALWAGVAQLAGSGGTSALAERHVVGAASLDGEGEAAAGGHITKFSTGALSASGALSGGSGHVTRGGTAALGGYSSLYVQAELGPERLARANLSGAGLVLGDAVQQRYLTPGSVSSFCGEDVGAEAAKSIDDDLEHYWRHSMSEYHWIVYDLTVQRRVSKIRIYQSAVPAERWGR